MIFYFCLHHTATHKKTSLLSFGHGLFRVERGRSKKELTCGSDFAKVKEVLLCAIVWWRHKQKSSCASHKIKEWSVVWTKAPFVAQCGGDTNTKSSCASHKIKEWSVVWTKAPFESVPQTKKIHLDYMVNTLT
jgi:hypothetical protein